MVKKKIRKTILLVICMIPGKMHQDRAETRRWEARKRNNHNTNRSKGMV